MDKTVDEEWEDKDLVKVNSRILEIPKKEDELEIKKAEMVREEEKAKEDEKEREKELEEEKDDDSITRRPVTAQGSTNAYAKDGLVASIVVAIILVLLVGTVVYFYLR